MNKEANYIQIIRDVYPGIPIETVHLNQNGQFNDILVVNEEIIFRFPKTLREADKLMTESALLWNLQGPVGYGEQFLDRFSAIYPGIENVLSRARFYAGTFALQEALYGLEDDDQEAFARGIQAYS